MFGVASEGERLPDRRVATPIQVRQACAAARWRDHFSRVLLTRVRARSRDAKEGTVVLSGSLFWRCRVGPFDG
jgi:hypothetical protein